MLCGLLLGLLEGFGHGVFELEMEWSGERERWKRMECERKGGLVVYKRDEITVFRAKEGGTLTSCLFVMSNFPHSTLNVPHEHVARTSLSSRW